MSSLAGINKCALILKDILSAYLSKDKGAQEKRELEITIKRAVSECIQEKTSKEQSEIIKGLLEVVKDIVGHLSESKNVFDSEKITQMMNDTKTKKKNETLKEEDISNKEILQLLKQLELNIKDVQEKARGASRRPNERERDETDKFRSRNTRRATNHGRWEETDSLPWSDGPYKKGTSKENQKTQTKKGNYVEEVAQMSLFENPDKGPKLTTDGTDVDKKEPKKERLKLLVNAELNEKVLCKANPKQETKDIVLIARNEEEIVTCIPKTVGELLEFLDYHPNAHAIGVGLS